jgi:hypothetical protein
MVDWDALPTDRDPTVVDYKDYGYGYSHGYGNYNKDWWKTYDSKADTTAYKGYTWQEDDEYFETEMLFDALYDAQAGYKDDLIEMIAECVYAEDPDFAIKFLSKRKLTDDLLEEAKQMARAYDVSTVLCTLFDAIHCEV